MCVRIFFIFYYGHLCVRPREAGARRQYLFRVRMRIYYLIYLIYYYIYNYIYAGEKKLF